jgi:hypothetical protein
MTSAEICAANGVLFRDPLNPDFPGVDQKSTFPFESQILTTVLLNVARICAMPSAGAFFFVLRDREPLFIKNYSFIL